MTQAELEPATGTTSHAILDQLFDWRRDAERFSRLATAARQAGRADPLALAEAECSLDLIDGELAALSRRSDRPAEQEKALLKQCRARIALAIRAMSQL